MSKAAKVVKSITVYTDGSCRPTNPGPGGYAIIIPVNDVETVTISKGFKLTTNNRMELMAVVETLKEFGPNKTFDIHLDSEYTKGGCMSWVKSWHRNNWIRKDWKTGEVKPIQNLDLWKEVYPLLKENKIFFHKVKAHTGDKYNEMADVAAKAAAENPTEEDTGYLEQIKNGV